MESKVVMFCAIVAVLGVISAALGFAGEATKVKANAVYIMNFECVYPSSPALGLGIAAAVFAIITRIYISLIVGACNCRREDSTASMVSKLFYVFSWIASVIAVVLLLTAASLNNREGAHVDSFGWRTCYFIKPGIFAAGAVMALLSAFFGIASYITLIFATQTTTNLAVAQPVVANIDPKKSPVPLYQMPPQQYPQQQYQMPPQQYPPQQYYPSQGQQQYPQA